MVLTAASMLDRVPPVAHHLLAAFAPAAQHPHNHLIQLFISFGLVGLFLVSVVDSSFVPLPIPGVTDILVVLYAAQHRNLFLLIASSTAGSALGGYLSYVIAQKGGMEFLEKHVPKRIFRRVTDWMEHHAVLSVSLPALLPPPMPLSPFVLAAGALRMRFRTFITAFTISRLLRHAIAAALGVIYGRQVLRLWNMFFEKYGTPVLIGIWVVILAGVGFALWRIWKTSKSVRRGGNQASPQPAAS